MAKRKNVPARPPDVATPDQADAPSIAHRIRDHAGALANALQLVRLTAGDDPRILNALDMADRQARALVELAAEVRDPA